jgi:hypothetical protein
MDENVKKQMQADANAQAQPAAQTTTTQTTAAGATSPPKVTSMPNANYTSPYDQQLKDLYTSITERKPFEYNADDDAMYQQYKDRYVQLGQQAMRDTMGQAAALTGGYGSSYGQAVGQQQYDQYMLGLNDKAADLYAQAYARYQDEGDQARQNYAMLGDLSDRDYGRWQDTYNRESNQYLVGVDEANARAAAGDFGGIAQLYGQDVADNMLANWAAQNPQLAYMQGAINDNQFANLMEGKPMNAPRSAAAAGAGVGVAGRSQSDIEREQLWALWNRSDKSNDAWTAYQNDMKRTTY